MKRPKRVSPLLRRLTLTSGGILLLQLSPSAVASAPKPPTATTGGSVGSSYTSATLTGTVNPEGSATSYYFQYGSSVAYSAQTPTVAVGTGSANVRVSEAISGLAVGDEYHYRIVAVSAAGTVPGQDRVLTTKKVPLRFEVSSVPRQVTYGQTLTIAGLLTGTAAADHQVVLQASPFPYFGAFANLGGPLLTGPTGEFSFELPLLSQSEHLRVATLDPVPVHSAVISVRVAAKVALHARPTRRPGYVRLYGTVTPSIPGAQVAFQWLRTGRAPAFVAGAIVRAAAGGVGRFGGVVYIAPGKGGYYRALVRVPDGELAPSASQAIRLRAAPAPSHRRTRRGRRRG